MCQRPPQWDLSDSADRLHTLVTVNRRQKKRKEKHRSQHAKVTRTSDRPAIVISGEKLPRVDNAHIVPRMYQSAWEGPKRQVAVHRVGKEGCELRSTKRAGTRRAYYRRTRPQGNEIDDFEASLAGVEGRATKPLRDLIAGELITVERKGEVAQLLAVQMMRGPAFFKAHEALMEQTIEQMGRRTSGAAIWPRSTATSSAPARG